MTVFYFYIRKLIVVVAVFFIFSSSIGFSQVGIDLDKSPFANIQIGESVNTTFEISNRQPIDVNFSIYLTDYRQDLTETFYDAPNTTPRSNASWITIGTSEFTVPANSNRTIPFELSVPNNPELVGSYWSLVMVEPQAVNQVTSEGLTIVNRYAVSVITTLPGGDSDFSFQNPVFDFNSSQVPQFTIDIINTGTKIADTQVYLDIFSQSGDELGRIDAGEVRFRPENPRQLNFDFSNLEGLDEGIYTALLIVDAGADNLFGARYSLNFKQN